MLKLIIVTSIHRDFDARIWKHATSLVKQGIEVHLVCPWLCDFEELEGVKMHTFPRVQKRWQRIFLIPLRVGKTLKPLMKLTAIIHFHDIDLLPFMTILSILGKHVVYDVHENYSEEMLVRSWVPKYLRNTISYIVFHGERILARIVRNVVLVTEAQEKTFQHPAIRKIFIRNYASAQIVDRAEDNYCQRKDSVIFIGNHYDSNGSLLLLEIAQKLKDCNHAIPFVVTDRFTSKKFRDYFVEQIKIKGLEEIIQMTPNVISSQVVSLLNKATIAINPVLRVPKQIMAINTKLFEFMAAGLPIVSSDLPYPDKLIKELNCGILAKPENPESFVKAIICLIKNRQLAYQLGKNGQHAIKDCYSWESQMPSLINFYKKIVIVR